jgi:hypothetical protein
MIASWTHPPTGAVVELATIEALTKTYRSHPRHAARKAAWQQLHIIGVQLTEIIRDLEHRLDRGDAILAAAPDDAKEDRWIHWLRSLETACDARSLIEAQVVDHPELLHRQDRRGAV